MVKVGDKVRILSTDYRGKWYHSFKAGSIVEVFRVFNSGLPRVDARGIQGTLKNLTQIVPFECFELVNENNTNMKVNDQVTVIGNNGNGYRHHFPIPTNGKIINIDTKNNLYTVENSKNQRQVVHLSNLTQTFTESQLKTNTMNISRQERKNAVETVANYIMGRDGNITTLFLKNELRVQYPAILWNQYQTGTIPGVSDLFHELVRDGKFKSIKDNGTYQTYVPVNYTGNAKATAQLTKALKKASATSTNPTVTARGQRGLVKGSATALAAGKAAAATRARNKAAKNASPAQNVVVNNGNATTTAPKNTPVTGTVVKVGKKEARKLIMASKGIISVTFKKQDGTDRTLAGVVVKNQVDDGLGYILMKDLVKTKKTGKDEIRNANIQTIEYFKTKGVTYQVK